MEAFPQGIFSTVVKRILPEPGTLGAFMNFVEVHQTQKLFTNQAMEQTLELRSSAKNDPWT
jgi:hypothetical protein